MTALLVRENFTRRADEILSLIGRLRQDRDLKEAIQAVAAQFIDQEPQAELRRLGEVLAVTRQQAVVQGRLDTDREALHHGNLSHEQRISTGHHYEMLRHAACTYNHLLRGLIESCSQYVSRDELLGWLSAASAGRTDWARGEITGAVSEIALHAALQGLPEIHELRYGSIDEDLIGYDFVGEWEGNLLTIDAKTGFYAPLGELKHGHRHLEISVPREAVDGLTINHRGLRLLRREVRQVLRRESGVGAHAPHHYFQAAQTA